MDNIKDLDLKVTNNKNDSETLTFFIKKLAEVNITTLSFLKQINKKIEDYVKNFNKTIKTDNYLTDTNSLADNDNDLYLLILNNLNNKEKNI